MPAVSTGCGTDLHEGAPALAQQTAHRALEPHRLAQVAKPVLRVQAGRVHASPVTVERNGTSPERGSIPAHPPAAPRGSPRSAPSARRSPPGSACAPAPPPPTRASSSSSVLARRRPPPSRPVHRRHRHAPLQRSSRRARSRLAPAATDTIPPLPGKPPSSRLRTATSRAASSQRQAARHVRRRDLALRVPDHRIRAHAPRRHRPGQRDHHREQRRLHHVHAAPGPAPPSAPRSTSSSDQSTSGSSASRTLAQPRREQRGRVQQLRPIPAHCAPWPGNTNDRSARGVGVGRARDHAAASPRASAPSPSSSSSRSPPSTTARCSNAAARLASEKPTSPASSSGLGRHVARAAAPPAPAAPPGSSPTAPTAAPSGPAPAPMIVGAAASAHLRARHVRAALSSVLRLGAGASSRITCALVPLIPNEETPAGAACSPARPRHRLGQQRDRAGRPVDVRARARRRAACAAAARGAAPSPS